MLRGNNEKIYVIEGYNFCSIYQKFNDLTHLDIGFEVDQEYGTECTAYFKYKENLNIENEIKQAIEANEKGDEIYIGETEIIQYLQSLGYLPKCSILIKISY